MIFSVILESPETIASSNVLLRCLWRRNDKGFDDGSFAGSQIQQEHQMQAMQRHLQASI